MLKLGKGTKKSLEKKRKKEEAKDKAELELLKRERAREQAEQSGGKKTPIQEEPREESEDWKKFLALTAGVDTLLSKTQEDLDRLKSAKATKKDTTPVESPDKKWIGFERGFDEDEELKRIEEEKNKKEESPVVEYEDPFLVPEDQAEDAEEEAEEDLFDTEYIEAVADVQLAYIPDSPTFNTGEPDPFDTSSVEKLIGKLPQESEKKKKQKLITLGNAAEVLAGIAEKPKELVLTDIKKRRPVEKREVDLFGGEELTDIVTVETVTTSKTLLDDSPPPSLPENIPVVSPGYLESKQIEVTPERQAEVEEDDEFASLALESLNKKVEIPLEAIEGLIPVDDIFQDLDESDDPFNTATAEELLRATKITGDINLIEKKKIPPLRPPPAKKGQAAALFDIFSPTRPRGESFEQFSNPESRKVSPPGEILKIPESDSSFDFNPREEEEAIPISPVSVPVLDIPETEETVGDFDPFDTSSVSVEAIDFAENALVNNVPEGEKVVDLEVNGESSRALEESDPFDTATVGL